MKDAVAVGLITAAAGALGNVLTWGAGRRSAEVELRRVESEDERLRVQHAEAERQHRQSYYHQALLLVTELSTLGGGYAELDEDIFDGWINRYWSVAAGVDLFGAPPVASALERYTGHVQDLLKDAQRRREAGSDWFDGWCAAWDGKRVALDDAGETLVAAMREDVAAHLS